MAEANGRPSVCCPSVDTGFSPTSYFFPSVYCMSFDRSTNDIPAIRHVMTFVVHSCQAVQVHVVFPQWKTSNVIKSAAVRCHL